MTRCPVLARTWVCSTQTIGNAVGDLGDLIHDGNRADEDTRVELVLGGLR